MVVESNNNNCEDEEQKKDSSRRDHVLQFCYHLPTVHLTVRSYYGHS